MLKFAWDKLIKPVYVCFVLLLGRVKWEWLREKITGKRFGLTNDDHAHIRDILEQNYCIILTRRNSHLSSYLVSIAGLILRFKYSHWAHALINVEDEAESLGDFVFMEATGIGTHYSSFMQVFDCDSVCLLKPRNVSLDEWNNAFLKMRQYLGRPYDTLFDLLTDNEINCVELVWLALTHLGKYEERFPNFEKLRKRYKKITPQMLYDCGDFEVVFEKRR